jgi:hypothetical protein
MAQGHERRQIFQFPLFVPSYTDMKVAWPCCLWHPHRDFPGFARFLVSRGFARSSFLESGPTQ